MTTEDIAADLWLSAQAGLSAADAERVRAAATSAGERPARAARRLGLVDDEALARALSAETGLPVVGREAFPAAAVWADRLSARFMRSVDAIALGEFEDDAGRSILSVALADPTDREAVHAIAAAAGGAVAFVVAPYAEIERAAARLAGQDTGDGGEGADAETVERLLDRASEAPVVQLLETLLAEAARRGASDLHLESARDRLRARVRVDGVLLDIGEYPARLARPVVSRVKIVAGLDIAERRLPQDGRARVTVAGRTLDLRVAVGPSGHGENVVVRLLEDRPTEVVLGDLGFGPEDEAKVRRALAYPYGLILAAGPTGAGKSTTLAAAVRALNDPGRKIVTIEDPIEHQIDGVHQIAVRAEIDLTFARALRAILRHDPDVIVVGELRDPETAEIAVDAALTGHLVLATVHANTSTAATPRLLDLGVDPAILRSTLRLVIAQRLARRLCAQCKRPAAAPGWPFPPAPQAATVFEAVGCPACGGTGYRGRLGLFEVLEVGEDVAAAIRAGVSSGEIEAIARRDSGLRLLFEDGARHVFAGETSADEVRRVLGVV